MFIVRQCLKWGGDFHNGRVDETKMNTQLLLLPKKDCYFLSPQKVTKKGFQQDASLRTGLTAQSRENLGCNLLPCFACSWLSLLQKLLCTATAQSHHYFPGFWPKLLAEKTKNPFVLR